MGVLKGGEMALLMFFSLFCYQALMKRCGRVLTASHRRWTVLMMGYLWMVVAGGAWGLDGYFWGAGLMLLVMMPLGFFVPHIWSRFQSAVEVCFVGYVFSAMLVLLARPDETGLAVAQVVMGLVGTLLGFIFWQRVGCYHYYRHCFDRTRALSRGEPFVYVMLAVCSVLVFYNY